MNIAFFKQTRRKKRLTMVFIDKLTMKNKYETYKMVNESYFLNAVDKRLFNTYYRINVKVALWFKRMLALKYQRKRIYDCDFDLSLQQLRPATTVSLFHHDMLYKFSIFDLMKIIKTALFYSDYLFIETQVPRNPYNGKEFTYGNFISMYSFMSLIQMRVPIYFELFRNCSFCKERFIEKNEPYIKMEIIKEYCMNNDDIDQVYGDIIIMLRNYRTNGLIIHPEYPKKLVVETFRTYLYRHFVNFYSYNYTLREKYKVQNERGIQRFILKNPTFGRIMYSNKFCKKIKQSSEKNFRFYNLLSHDIPDFTHFSDLEDFNSRVLEPDTDDEQNIPNHFENVGYEGNQETNGNETDGNETEEDYTEEDVSEDEFDIILRNPGVLRDLDNLVLRELNIINRQQNNES